MKFSSTIICLILISTAKAGSWPNEPTGSRVLYDCDFNNNNVCGLSKDFNTQTDMFTNDSAAPFSPSGVLDSFMYAGATQGQGAWHFPLGDAKELYFGTWWKTNADFEGMCNNTNKMLFFRRPEMDNSFVGWQGLPGINNAKTLVWGNQTAYSNVAATDWTGDASGLSGWFAPNVGNATALPGSGWHRIEVYIKTSTGKQSFDGIFRLWFDGALAINVPNINQSPGGLTEFNVNHTWDGSYCLVNRDLSKSWHHYFDHMHISVPNGGAVVIPPPTSAPAKPNNLKFL